VLPDVQFGNKSAIILWQDAEAASNGAKAFGPTWFAKNLAPHLASDPMRSTGEGVMKDQGKCDGQPVRERQAVRSVGGD
jgi:hypothetical protein